MSIIIISITIFIFIIVTIARIYGTSHHPSNNLCINPHPNPPHPLQTPPLYASLAISASTLSRTLSNAASCGVWCVRRQQEVYCARATSHVTPSCVTSRGAARERETTGTPRGREFAPRPPTRAAAGVVMCA
eukprot:749038-Rhodomonas_salina.1